MTLPLSLVDGYPTERFLRLVYGMALANVSSPRYIEGPVRKTYRISPWEWTVTNLFLPFLDSFGDLFSFFEELACCGTVLHRSLRLFTHSALWSAFLHPRMRRLTHWSGYKDRYRAGLTASPKETKPMVQKSFCFHGKISWLFRKTEWYTRLRPLRASPIVPMATRILRWKIMVSSPMVELSGHASRDCPRPAEKSRTGERL